LGIVIDGKLFYRCLRVSFDLDEESVGDQSIRIGMGGLAEEEEGEEERRRGSRNGAHLRMVDVRE
jgi:hypothetical protein